ncbi:MAG: hypothetical protein NW215_04085 [Hyphomicrobiales bacterium]|nr:hypothetical protein [Hyphomicrobiales bacterium]
MSAFKTAVAVKVSAAFLAVALGSSAFTPAEAAMCKPYNVTATSVILNNKDAARFNAKQRWSTKVGGTLGVAWKSWSNAKGRDVDCFKAGFGFKCNASAKPCK